MKNPEKRAFKCLSVLTRSFIEDLHLREGDQKTFSIGNGFHLNLELLEMDRLHNLFLVRALDDNELESCAWKIEVYSLGFVRTVTFEQNGTIRLRANREEDKARDYDTYARINGFFQQFMEECISTLCNEQVRPRVKPSMECAA